MNKLTIYRRYFDFGTYSTLELGDETLLVIEPPWIGDGYPSGKPYESCIPEGLYQLSKHNGREVQGHMGFRQSRFGRVPLASSRGEAAHLRIPRG
jgi:hypothetical protein